MKAMDLLVGLNAVRDAYVQDAQKFRQGKSRPKRLPVRKLWLAAALIALSLLLVGCAVVYVLRMQDMKIGEKNMTQEEWIGPSGEYAPSTQWTITELSLQGYNGSPEQLALREWLDFKMQYDSDGTLMKENNRNDSGVPAQYYITYDCYTFEMVDKLNEILEKYQLNALGAWIHFHRWEEQLLYKALQIDNLCQPGIHAEKMEGYFSPEGAFHTEFWQSLEGEQEQRMVAYTYARDGYFYPYYSVIGDMDAWEQWHYTTLAGTDVLLATCENALVIICDREDGIIHITTENKMANAPYDNTAEPMTREKAEIIADSFNYSIFPQPCDPSNVEAMRAGYPEPVRQTSFLTGFAVDTKTGRLFPPEEVADSFEHYISHLLSNENSVDNRAVEQLEYCVTDLNNDGQPEILIQYRDTGKYREILEMADYPDTQHQGVSLRFINGYVYEGPVFELISDNTKWDGFLYHEYKDFSWKNLDCLRYDPAADVWERSSTCADTPDAVWEPITAEELHALQSSYVPLSLDMQPLSRFSMERW